MSNSFLFLSVLIFFVSSCSSSNSTNRQRVSSWNIDLENLSWIEDVEVKKVKPISYRKRLDQYRDLKIKKNAFNRESLFRIPASKIDAISKESKKDEILNMAILCYGGDFNEFEKVSKEKYRKFSKNPTFWNLVGTCNLLQKKYLKAELYYKKALGINSKYIPAINNLGLLKERSGAFNESLGFYKKASQINKNAQIPLFNMSQIYLRFHFAKKALKVLNRLIEKNDPDIFWQRQQLT